MTNKSPLLHGMESVVNSKPTTKNDKSQKGDLYLWGVGIVNDSPATKQMIAEVFGQLACDKEIEVFTKDKKERRGGVKISEHDLIRIPQITSFLPIRRHGE